MIETRENASETAKPCRQEARVAGITLPSHNSEHATAPTGRQRQPQALRAYEPFTQTKGWRMRFRGCSR